VDVVVVDAADERLDGDQFPGVGVVELVRQRRSSVQTTVVVVTGHFFNDALRRRMKEAGADFFFHRSEVQDAARLRQVVLHPDLDCGVPDVADPETLVRLGIGRSTRVNDAVRFGTEAGLVGRPVSHGGPRSRAWMRLRRAFNDVARLQPTTADGRPTERAEEPSRPQIARMLDWATRARRD
jgi:hypothetical protein